MSIEHIQRSLSGKSKFQEQLEEKSPCFYCECHLQILAAPQENPNHLSGVTWGHVQLKGHVCKLRTDHEFSKLTMIKIEFNLWWWVYIQKVKGQLGNRRQADGELYQTFGPHWIGDSNLRKWADRSSGLPGWTCASSIHLFAATSIFAICEATVLIWPVFTVSVGINENAAVKQCLTELKHCFLFVSCHLCWDAHPCIRTALQEGGTVSDFVWVWQMHTDLQRRSHPRQTRGRGRRGRQWCNLMLWFYRFPASHCYWPGAKHQLGRENKRGQYRTEDRVSADTHRSVYISTPKSMTDKRQLRG